MPRTTLSLDTDAIKIAKMHASRHRLTLGAAVSELIRQAAERPLATEERSGLQVVCLSPRSPKVTGELVARLREEWP